MSGFAFDPEAEAEYDDALAWYDNERAGLASVLRTIVETAISAIVQNPEMHSRFEDTDVRKCVLKRFPYNLFYLEHENEIVIVALAHHKRKPGYWRQRLDDI